VFFVPNSIVSISGYHIREAGSTAVARTGVQRYAMASNTSSGLYGEGSR